MSVCVCVHLEEEFNWKGKLLYGPLNKDPRKSLAKCLECDNVRSGNLGA